MRRREFLAAASAAALPAKEKYAPKLAVQCYVWTQWFDREKIKPAEGVERMFAGCREAGFERIQLVSWLLTPELREKTLGLAQQYGFKVPLVYSNGKTVEDLISLAEAVKPAGLERLIINPEPKPKRERKSDEELAAQARFVEQAREALQKIGIPLLLHHHDPEMQEGAREWWHLLKNTKAGLCIDTDWVWQGGQDALELLRAGGSRVGDIHLRNARGKVWTESLDEGDYDYPAVAKHLRAAGYNGYLTVELAWRKETALTRTLPENLKRSRLWVEKVFGLKPSAS
ncbi:MAG: sugar phosphate isomerase/epimerase [Bryobacteraceae bacterium]|nr:sugar phosphate isomerase/epimerase [Bryobacteraceae bacterium]